MEADLKRDFAAESKAMMLQLNVWIDGTTSLFQVDHVLAVRHLPGMHRDPLDRRVVVQASQEGLGLRTADRTLEGYGDMGRPSPVAASL